ncbi:DUF559 domain-containing protein [Okibacterium endophyticum]
MVAGDPLRMSDQAREIAVRAGQYRVRMLPHEFFSHTTAATLWGAPLPFLPDARIHVSVLSPGRGPRARGVIGHEVQSALVNPMEVNGIRIASPASTWASLGLLLHPYDLVAVGDYLVRIQRHPGGFRPTTQKSLATLAQLDAAMCAGRRPGLAAVRKALPRVRTGSSSRLESWTRLILTDAGLPEPDLDVDVHDENSMFIGCVDLAYESLKIAIEYDGDQHRTSREQFTRDIDKLEQLTAAGWRVVRLTSTHVFGYSGRELVRRVRTALHERGWRG